MKYFLHSFHVASDGTSQEVISEKHNTRSHAVGCARHEAGEDVASGLDYGNEAFRTYQGRKINYHLRAIPERAIPGEQGRPPAQLFKIEPETGFRNWRDYWWNGRCWVTDQQGQYYSLQTPSSAIASWVEQEEVRLLEDLGNNASMIQRLRNNPMAYYQCIYTGLDPMAALDLYGQARQTVEGFF